MADKKDNKEVNIQNRKARFEFAIGDKFEAGIELTGPEIKSIRAGEATINDAFCFMQDGEVLVKGMHITEYENASTHVEHEPDRFKKLLLHKREIAKIEKALDVQGTTVVVLRLYTNARNKAKLEIAIAKGKKQWDKRETIKKRDNDRETMRELNK
jgi:SsrA-binding protein